MKIVVCYKNVANSESIKINSDGSLDFSQAAWEIGQYDMNAIEAAASIAAAVPGSSVIALTVAGGIVDNSKLRKAVLSRGPDMMVGVKDESLDSADAYVVAHALAAAINRLGGVDLVLFGEGSGDIYAQQTGVLTGALLGWNTVNAVQHIGLCEDKLRLTRSSPDMFEELEVSLPAAVCVTGDINRPRIPTLKEILAAGKKPVEIINLSELGVDAECGVTTVSILAPEQTERKQIVYENATPEDYASVIQTIQKGR